MSNPNKIASLKTLSSDLLDNTLAEIRSHRKESFPPKDKYFLTAEYFLQGAKEYVVGAWEMIISGKSNASIALSRWVLEASLNLMWVVADRNKIDERLAILCGEALRNEACLLEGLAELWPDKSQLYKKNADKVREEKRGLRVKDLRPLKERLDSIETQLGMADWPELYPLYRICCASAHPSLKIWELFSSTNGQTVSRNPIDKQQIACWMAADAAFYLVVSTYKLTELGDSKQLKEWWEKEVRPLLNDD